MQPKLHFKVKLYYRPKIKQKSKIPNSHKQKYVSGKFLSSLVISYDFNEKSSESVFFTEIFGAYASQIAFYYL